MSLLLSNNTSFLFKVVWKQKNKETYSEWVLEFFRKTIYFSLKREISDNPKEMSLLKRNNAYVARECTRKKEKGKFLFFSFLFSDFLYIFPSIFFKLDGPLWIPRKEDMSTIHEMIAHIPLRGWVTIILFVYFTLCLLFGEKDTK